MRLLDCLSVVCGRVLRTADLENLVTAGLQLQALDVWLQARGDATVSVGCVASDALRRCTIYVHDQTFSATASGDGYATTWQAILGAISACETYEASAGATVQA